MVPYFKMDISFILHFRLAGQTDLFPFFNALINLDLPGAQMGVNGGKMVVMLDDGPFPRILSTVRKK